MNDNIKELKIGFLEIIKNISAGQQQTLEETVLKNAGNRCEMCYAPNGARIARFHNDKDIVVPWEIARNKCYNNADTIGLKPYPLDSYKNKDPDAYLALCAFCRYKINKYNRKKNRIKK